MSNVYAFPGVSLDLSLEGNNAFTPAEITVIACSHIAWCISEKTNPAYGQIMTGMTDEGDGWLYASHLVRRSAGWTDTSPLVRLEKSNDGVTGRFYKTHWNPNDDHSPISIFKCSSVDELIDQRQPIHTHTLTRLLFDRHSSKAEQIAAEIEQQPERLVTTEGSHPSALRSFDYDLITKLHSLVNNAAVQSIIEEVGGTFG